MNKKLDILFRNRAINNGLWLYLLQMFNMVVPLLTLPYITRVLGAAQYGLFSISLNWITYFQVIVEYGFNLTGVRKVALAESKEEISRIFSSIVYCKLLLCLISFMMLLIISFVLKVSETQFICMSIIFTMVIGEALRQTWLFQGLQEMKNITLISVISRTASMLLIFVFIHDSSHLFLYSAFYAITYLLIGILGMVVARAHFKTTFVRIPLKDLVAELRDGWYLFTSMAMSGVFTGIGVTVLGFAGTDADVGIYSAIQKIPYIMILMFMPIGQIIYPYISKKYAMSLEYGINVLRKPTKYILLFFGFASIFLVLFSKQIVKILYGEEYMSFSLLMLPLVIWMMFSIINNLLGIQILVASGHQKEYSFAFQIGVLTNVTLNVSLGMLWNKFGVAIAAMTSELVLTFALSYYIRKVVCSAKDQIYNSGKRIYEH